MPNNTTPHEDENDHNSLLLAMPDEIFSIIITMQPFSEVTKLLGKVSKEFDNRVYSAEWSPLLISKLIELFPESYKHIAEVNTAIAEFSQKSSFKMLQLITFIHEQRKNLPKNANTNRELPNKFSVKDMLLCRIYHYLNDNPASFMKNFNKYVTKRTSQETQSSTIALLALYQYCMTQARAVFNKKVTKQYEVEEHYADLIIMLFENSNTKHYAMTLISQLSDDYIGIKGLARQRLIIGVFRQCSSKTVDRSIFDAISSSRLGEGGTMKMFQQQLTVLCSEHHHGNTTQIEKFLDSRSIEDRIAILKKHSIKTNYTNYAILKLAEYYHQLKIPITIGKKALFSRFTCGIKLLSSEIANEILWGAATEQQRKQILNKFFLATHFPHP